MIKYVKHPVSPELKQELRAKGYKILDERFKPEGYQDPDEAQDKPKKRKVAKKPAK